MMRKMLDLETRAKELLRRLQRHGQRPLTEFEIRRILKEIQVIGRQNLTSYDSNEALARVDGLLKQAVEEAQSIVARTVSREAQYR